MIGSLDTISICLNSPLLSEIPRARDHIRPRGGVGALDVDDFELLVQRYPKSLVRQRNRQSDQNVLQVIVMPTPVEVWLGQ